MGLSLSPQRIRQVRTLFEHGATSSQTGEAEITGAAEPMTARTLTALLAVDTRAAALLRQFGYPPVDFRTLSRWDRLRALLDRATNLPPVEQNAMLDALSDADDVLRADLKALFSAFEQAPNDFSPGPDQAPEGAGAGSESPDPIIGATIAQYRVLSRLGRGGMGVVYKALDTSLDRTVAIKFLPSELHANPEADARFVHEARAVSGLDHPNIATVHEIGRTNDGQRFIVMAFYAGETLRQKIHRGALPIAQVIDYGLQIARGLQRAHEHGIVHRDIKPENIIVTERGLLKILDFGLAKQQDVQLTVTGMTMGTLAYMSPEQTFGGDVDQRADIWALGIVLFELLTGRHPFMPGTTPLPSHVGDSVGDTARALRPEAPDALPWTLDAMLRRDPTQRPAHMALIVEDLERLREPMSTAALTGAMATQAMVTQAIPLATDAPALRPAPRPWWPLRSWQKVVFGGLVLVVVTVLGLWLLRPASSSTREPAAARAEARALHEDGFQHLNEGQLALAQAAFERALAVDSTYSEAWASLAAALYRQRQFSEAIAHSRTAIRWDSTSFLAYQNLALALEDTGQLEQAIEAYNTALTIKPTYIPAYSALGNLYINDGNPEQALRVLEQGANAVDDSPLMFLVFKNMAKAHLALGRPAVAVPLLERALQRQPDWPETLALLAESHALLDQADRSQVYLDRYLNVERDLFQRQALLEKLGKE